MSGVRGCWGRGIDAGDIKGGKGEGGRDRWGDARGLGSRGGPGGLGDNVAETSSRQKRR